ncbi:MAG: zinc ribbon domain-containing protein [Gaiellaceae bacterium]
MAACSHCGGPLPDDATFCPSCGRRADAPRAFARDVPIDVQNAEPRYFGLGPPVFVFAVAVGLLVLGVVLLLAGSFVVGVIAIVIAVAMLPVFLAGARRWPDTPLARAGVSTAERVRDEAGVAAESLSTLSRAGRDVARIRKEQFQLRRERDAKIRELGPSYYSDDGRAEELKSEARELDARIATNERTLQRTVAGARRRVRKGRATVTSTEIIKAEPTPEPRPDPVTEAAPALTDEQSVTEVASAAEPKPAKKRQARSR